VRDGRRQLASGEIIPFLNQQQASPEVGSVEAKRARRREKEAFLNSVFSVKNTGTTKSTRSKSKDPRKHAAAAVAERRPPRAARRASETPGLGGDLLAAKGADGRGQPRRWPYGTVGLEASSRQGAGAEGESRAEERLACSGEDTCSGGADSSAVGDSDDCSADVALRPGSPEEAPTVVPDAGAAGDEDSSRETEKEEVREKRRTIDWNDPDQIGTGNAQNATSSQDLQRGLPGKGTMGDCTRYGRCRVVRLVF